MADKHDPSHYRENRQNELDSAFPYRTLAEAEEQPQLAQVYRRLAEVEEQHAVFWEEQLREAGEEVTPHKTGWRSRTLAALARSFGRQLVLPTINALEQAYSSGYAGQEESRGTALPSEERSHARLLRTITAPGGGIEGGALAQLEGRHRAASGNALRAAVLGANDGLLSNFSLVMGVAGAALSNQAILITVLAGLLAGAGSMAMGEWISVQSSRELYERQISIEAEELRLIPDEEEEELSLIYQSKGVPEEEARRTAPPGSSPTRRPPWIPWPARSWA